MKVNTNLEMKFEVEEVLTTYFRVPSDESVNRSFTDVQKA